MPLRVDVDSSGKIEAWQTFRGNEWDNRGERIGGGTGEVDVNARVAGRKDYYEAKGGCELFFPPGNGVDQEVWGR